MDTNITNALSKIPDPRVINRCHHKLSDILFIALSTIICNGEDFEDMEEFGNQRYEWLKTILELPNGIPSHDTFNRVLQKLEPDALSKLLASEGELLLNTIKEKLICIDGKKTKGVSPKKKGNQGLYILSAWVSENSFCIGQKKVADKSNEITAIPELIKELDIKDAVISIDAIGCQKKIAEQIKEKKGDYLLSLKNNQKESYQQVQEAFKFHKPNSYDEKTEKNHGRLEVRKCSIIQVENLPIEERPQNWEGLETLVRIESVRKTKEKEERALRYYLSSEKEISPKYYNMLVRGHWAIENHLHWHLDVTFNEDASRARVGYSQQNLNILRKVALQRITQMKDKLSKKKRRYRASLNNEYLKKILII
ncbi:MAG TPA: ISAs1 family transposase [Bacteroidetes bacterium]|nr:ISAs1 family transposase [Bacteroidota bacterium]